MFSQFSLSFASCPSLSKSFTAAELPKLCTAAISLQFDYTCTHICTQCKTIHPLQDIQVHAHQKPRQCIQLHAISTICGAHMHYSLHRPLLTGVREIHILCIFTGKQGNPSGNQDSIAFLKDCIDFLKET